MVTTDRQRFQLLTPKDMLLKAESAGMLKGRLPAARCFLLSILAGAFIAIGANFYTIVVTSSAEWHWPFGLGRLLGGAAFSVGLILVVVGGGELFTGNNLMVIAARSGKIRWLDLLRNWFIVYTGNFVGALATAGLVVGSHQYSMAGGEVGRMAMKVAAAKATLPFSQALCAGILCNLLVCLAVWLGYSARTMPDKFLAIVLPVTAFVAGGFEHCVANMYFIPVGMMISSATASHSPATISQFLVSNLLPVTLGNILGGAGVGLAYLLAYRPKPLPIAIPESDLETSRT